MNLLFEVYIFLKYIFTVYMPLIFRLITDTHLAAHVIQLNV
jgi:hypothetical protein